MYNFETSKLMVSCHLLKFLVQAVVFEQHPQEIYNDTFHEEYVCVVTLYSRGADAVLAISRDYVGGYKSNAISYLTLTTLSCNKSRCVRTIQL